MSQECTPGTVSVVAEFSPDDVYVDTCGLSTDTVDRGEVFTVEFTVANDNGTEANAEVSVAREGSEVWSDEMTLGSSATKSQVYEDSVDLSGEYDYTVEVASAQRS